MASERKSLHCHANLWTYEKVYALQSPYNDPVYKQRANKLIEEVKEDLNRIGQIQNISPSAYDTAWVAMVPCVDNLSSSSSSFPQFPQCLQWIVSNQLDDGSWGSSSTLPSSYHVSDKLLSTLACVVALRTWHAAEDSVQKGKEYLKGGLKELNETSKEDQSMVTDFKIIFPMLLREAKRLCLSLPYDLPCIAELSKVRERRLVRRKAMIASGECSSLVCSLEGIPDLIDDWTRFINVKCSPASTACVLIHTKDPRCLQHITELLSTHWGDFVPCFFSVDILERLLVVDNIERLGVDRHFIKEIDQALHYVYSAWSNEKGLSWSTSNPSSDLETTALGFGLLRLHGYEVDPNVFKCFFREEEGGELVMDAFCHEESNHNKQATDMLRLYMASQLSFPGEGILDKTKNYSMVMLKDAIDNKETHYVELHFLQQIRYALETQWHVCAPRIEAKRYSMSYTPEQPLVGKSVYRIGRAYNHKLQELAKLDFNILQAMYQEEMKVLSKWFTASGLEAYEFHRQRPIEYFFWLGMALYDPEPGYGACRIALPKVACVQTLFDDFYDTHSTVEEARAFTEAFMSWDLEFAEGHVPDFMRPSCKVIFEVVQEVIDLVKDLYGIEVKTVYRKAWENFVNSYMLEAEWASTGCLPTYKEYIENALTSAGQPLLFWTTMFLKGQNPNLEEMEGIQKLSDVYSSIWRLKDDTMTYKAEQERGEMASAIQCYRRDHHPHVTQEDASVYVHGILSTALKELVRQLSIENACPRIVKRVCVDMTRMVMLFYIERDGFGDSEFDIKDRVTECLVDPLPLN